MSRSGRLAALMLGFSALLAGGCNSSPALDPVASHAGPYPPRIVVLHSTSDAARQRDEAVWKKLHEPMEVKAKGTRLIHVIDALQESAGLNFYVNWGALEAAGIEHDTPPPELALKGATIETVLKLTLQQAALEAKLEPIGYAVIDGVVCISTVRDLQRHTETRTYVLPPTLLQPNDQRRISFDINEALKGRSSGGSETPQQPKSNDPSPATKPGEPKDEFNTYEDQIEDLTSLIVDTVGTQATWTIYGGEDSSLRQFNGTLIIRTTADNHRDIERLLMQIHQAGPSGMEALRNAEVEYLLAQADTLRLSQKYDEAQRLVNDAIFVHPTHIRALAMKNVLDRAQGRSAAIPSLVEPNPPRVVANDHNDDWGHAEHRSSQPPGGEDQTAAEALIRAVEKKLSSNITVQFEGNKLVHVLDYFRNTLGVSFIINWAALEAAGIEQDLPITLRLREVPADVALKIVMRQASGAARLEQMDFLVDDVSQDPKQPKAAVRVSTRAELSETTDTRVYPIHDLAAWMSELDTPRYLHTRVSRTGDAAAGRSYLSAMRMGPQPGTIEPVTLEEAIEHLVTLMSDMIGEQKGWAAYGGEIASCRELNQNLIIKAPPAWHRQIVQFLRNLRQVRMMSTIAYMQHREVLHLLHQADDLRMRQRYAEALQLTQQALRVDPQHEFALGLEAVLRETIARRAAGH